MSARWQKRKPQILFLHEILTYQFRNLYEISRNQLRSHSTPRKHKTRNSLIKMGKKIPLHFIPNWFSLAQLSVVKRKYPTCGSGGKESEM